MYTRRFPIEDSARSSAVLNYTVRNKERISKDLWINGALPSSALKFFVYNSATSRRCSKFHRAGGVIIARALKEDHIVASGSNLCSDRNAISSPKTFHRARKSTSGSFTLFDSATSLSLSLTFPLDVLNEENGSRVCT